MFCKNCGNQIDEGSKFCDKCGQSVESPNNIYNSPPTKNKQKKKLSIPMIILIIIIILGILGAISSNHTPTNSDNNSSSSIETSKNEKKYISLNEAISGKDWDITIKDIYFGQKIEPPEKPMFYNYYQVKDTNNTYLCIVIDAKNKSNLDLSASNVATLKVKYKDSYTYTSFSAIPDNSLGFTYTNITNIKPLTNNSIYYLAEMPNTISTETDTPIELELKFENQNYYYKYR